MNARIRLRFALAAAGALALSTAGAAAPAGKGIPSRPEQLVYGPLQFEIPRAEQYRHELGSGVVAYVVPDRSLPLVGVTLHLRTGAFREPADRPGLASLAASLARVGGTAGRTPEEFDERADFLAAQLSVQAAGTGTRASLNVLSTSLGDGLDLLFDMVRNPRFDDTRLSIEKGKTLEAMKQRNDDAGDIQEREWSWLMYGREHFESRRATAAELESITRADLVEFHRRTWGPEGLVIAVSGDVEPAAIVADLAARLAGWAAAEPAPWPPPAPEFEPRAGLYHVEKEIPQGKVTIGHRSLRVADWSDPELYALMVMNDVLGGGGFTARLMKRVRSDEGLAYGAYSSFGFGAFWEDTFEISYASKNPTVALAAKIALEEVERMRREPVSEEELRVSKVSFVDTLPRSFESAARIAATFAQDDLIGRPHSYWYDYRARIEAVDAERVLAAARERLHPDRLVMLVVGKWSEIEPGDAEQRAKAADLPLGAAVHLPSRDPLTLEPRP